MSVIRWLDKETMVHIYSGVLLSHKKEHIWVTSNEVGEPRACCTEWSKSEREKQMSYINTYIWNLERQYWWTYFQDKSRDTDTENKLMDTGRVGGGGRGWYERREQCGSMWLPYRQGGRRRKRVVRTERAMWEHVTTICNTGSQHNHLLCDSGNSHRGSVTT